MSHSVSYDATEDSPAGHTHGNGTGARQEEGCGERETVSEGRGGQGMEMKGRGGDVQSIIPFPLDSVQGSCTWPGEMKSLRSELGVQKW